MSIDFWTLALQAINFLVLIWLLQRFLYKPVMAIVERRRQASAQALAAAEQAKAAASAEAENLRRQQAATEAARDEVVRMARAEMEEERKGVLAQARGEADRIVAGGRQVLDEERAQALAGLKEQTAALACSLAESLLHEATGGRLAGSFLERLDERLAVMSKPERERLLGPLNGDATIDVTTAPALDDAERERWRSRLASHFAQSCTVTFATDDRLVAGARLEFPALTMESSWADAIERARKRMTADDAAA